MAQVLSRKTIKSLKDLKRKELRKLCEKHSIEYSKEMKGKELRKLLKNYLNKVTLVDPKSEDDLIIDFVNEMKSIDAAMEPYKEHKKDVRKKFRDFGIDSVKQKIAWKAFKILENQENMDEILKAYKSIRKNCA